VGPEGGEDIIIVAPNKVMYEVKHIDASWTLAGLCKLLLEQFPDDFKNMNQTNTIYINNDKCKMDNTKLSQTNYAEGDILQIGEKRKELADFNGTIKDVIATFTDTKKSPITIEIAWNYRNKI
jgi:hypothetical protein